MKRITNGEIETVDKSGAVRAVYNEGLGATRSEGVSYNPQIQAMSFPMMVGKRWEHNNGRIHPQCGKNVTELQSEAVAWEDITVPAGTFRALRIESRGYWRNSCGTDKVAYKFWYSPQVKWWVRTEGYVYAGGRLIDRTIRELTSYQVAKDE